MSTLEMRSTCVPGVATPSAPRATPRGAETTSGTFSGLDCAWDGIYTVKHPKGVVQRFRRNPAPGEAPAVPGVPGLIEQVQDANGNTTGTPRPTPGPPTPTRSGRMSRAFATR